MNVEISFEEARGCGYRKPSAGGVGIYLIGSGAFERCERLPFALTTCPCCGAGFSYSRGFSWLHPSTVLNPVKPPYCTVGEADDPNPHHDHGKCFLCNPPGGQHGLIWIGEKFYPTSDDFMREAYRMGISRKISALPHGFEIGSTVVYLAHRKVPFVERDFRTRYDQGIFTAFLPTRVDLVIDDPDDVPDKAINLAKKLGDACRIVKVIHDESVNQLDEEISEW